MSPNSLKLDFLFLKLPTLNSLMFVLKGLFDFLMISLEPTRLATIGVITEELPLSSMSLSLIDSTISSNFL